MRLRKLPGLMSGGIGPRIEIWRNSGLPFNMVQCLHQSSVYIKRKLGLWRTQTCIHLEGAKSPLICAATQSTPSHVRWYRAENRNLGKFGPTFRRGAVFATKQCSYQKEARAMESPKMYPLRRCKKPTCLGGYAKYPIPCKAV